MTPPPDLSPASPNDRPRGSSALIGWVMFIGVSMLVADLVSSLIRAFWPADAGQAALFTHQAAWLSLLLYFFTLPLIILSVAVIVVIDQWPALVRRMGHGPLSTLLLIATSGIAALAFIPFVGPPTALAALTIRLATHLFLSIFDRLTDFRFAVTFRASAISQALSAQAQIEDKQLEEANFVLSAAKRKQSISSVRAEALQIAAHSSRWTEQFCAYRPLTIATVRGFTIVPDQFAEVGAALLDDTSGERSPLWRIADALDPYVPLFAADGGIEGLRADRGPSNEADPLPNLSKMAAIGLFLPDGAYADIRNARGAVAHLCFALAYHLQPGSGLDCPGRRAVDPLNHSVLLDPAVGES